MDCPAFPPETSVMGEILEWILLFGMLASAAGMILWMAGAIYYDVGREGLWGSWLALGWAIVFISMLALWQPLWQPFVVLLGVTASFFWWWYGQKPSQERDWDTSVAVLPWVQREGEVVTIGDIRNFEYRSLEDCTPRYETRRFHLANLKAADLILFTWACPLMGHPVLVFDFGADGRICMSIEARYQKGQPYSILRSFYRQYELIFVAADERDVILRRTKCDQDQEALLYHFNASVDELRRAFLDYIEAIASLRDTPRWYHSLCANCTTSFYRLRHSRIRCDWRVVANGRLDKALYNAGRLDQSLPFQELRRLARINDIANRAPENGFGDHIRHELERRRHER